VIPRGKEFGVDDLKILERVPVTGIEKMNSKIYQMTKTIRTNTLH
jgi:hypothetical protein